MDTPKPKLSEYVKDYASLSYNERLYMKLKKAIYNGESKYEIGVIYRNSFKDIEFLSPSEKAKINTKYVEGPFEITDDFFKKRIDFASDNGIGWTVDIEYDRYQNCYLDGKFYMKF
jgi:hypothetical protein